MDTGGDILYYQSWCTMIYELQRQIAAQANQIKHLEQSLKKLKQEIEQLSEKPSTNIERIEYKFDQLKIETLEGTLNIGLNPNDLHSVEDFSVENNALTPSPMTNEAMLQTQQPIRSEIYRYLDEDSINHIQNLELEFNRSIGEPYYEYMIEDVKKQIDQRITYYINQYTIQLNSDEREKYQQIIIDKVKEDIDRSFSAFMENLPNDLKGGIFSEFHGD